MTFAIDEFDEQLALRICQLLHSGFIALYLYITVMLSYYISVLIIVVGCFSVLRICYLYEPL